MLADVDYARGRALQGLARFDDARAAYQAVIEARKGGDLAARAQLMIGETYFHQKNYHEAIREFLKVDYLYDAPSWQAAALLEAGKVHERLDQWADAAETYEKLRDKFPKDPSAAEAKSGSKASANASRVRKARPGPRMPANPEWGRPRSPNATRAALVVSSRVETVSKRRVGTAIGSKGHCVRGEIATEWEGPRPCIEHRLRAARRPESPSDWRWRLSF